MTSLEIRNLTYIYGEGTPFCHTALDDLTLRITPGAITGLIGHTGSGKSTLVQLLNGLLRPNAGQVLLNGNDIWANPKNIRDVRFQVGLVFQYPEYQLFEETVARDIAYGPTNMGLPADEIDRRVHDALRFCGLSEDLLQKSPFELSGGQKRRVAIAGIIAMEPEVLILDEPAAGLDPLGREEILGGIWSYQRQRQSTVILVSHSMEDIARYADEIVVLHQAKLMLQGSTQEVFRHADQLSACGLDIPQITHLMKYLKSRGLPVRDDIFTVADARDSLLSLLSSKGGKSK